MHNDTENLITSDGWEFSYKEPNEPDMNIYIHPLFPNVEIGVDRDGSWISCTTSPTELDYYRKPLFLEQIGEGNGIETLAAFLMSSKLKNYKVEEQQEQ